MRVLLSNVGTFGDIQPLLALGVELRRRGHDVTLASSACYEPEATRWGLAFRCVAPDLRDVIRRINIAIIAEPGVSYSPQGLQTLGAPLAAALPTMYAELLRASSDADVLVAGQLQPAGRMVHEKTGIPFASVQLTGVGSKGTAAYRRATEALVNPVRMRAGLPPIADPMTTGIDSPQLALYAMSRFVRPAQRAWPSHMHTTGYFFLDEPAWSPPETLESFLAAGAPPIAITFGSNMIDDVDRVARILTETLRRTGCRAIVQAGWGDLRVDVDASSVCVVDYVPHHWLFPRCAAVMHHGGAGTTAAVLRSGRPGIWVPHAFDQFLWAEVAHRVGCAPPPVHYATMTADRLVDALQAIQRDPAYATNAAACAARMATENGVETARVLIEDLWLQRGDTHVDHRRPAVRHGL